MADPSQKLSAAIARLEQKNAQQQRQYSESAGLLGTAPDPPFAGGGGAGGNGSAGPAPAPASLRPAAAAAAYRDDEGLLPVMIEDCLERIGAL